MKLSAARILVVDDDEVMRKFVVTMLTRLGAQDIQQCTDGSVALSMVTSFKPDLVLSDIHMQTMDGIEFVRRLREHPNPDIRQTRVMFMSADSSKTTLDEALPLGTYGYIVKPPRPEALRAKLDRALAA